MMIFPWQVDPTLPRLEDLDTVIIPLHRNGAFLEMGVSTHEWGNPREVYLNKRDQSNCKGYPWAKVHGLLSEIFKTDVKALSLKLDGSMPPIREEGWGCVIEVPLGENVDASDKALMKAQEHMSRIAYTLQAQAMSLPTMNAFRKNPEREQMRWEMYISMCFAETDDATAKAKKWMSNKKAIISKEHLEEPA